MGIKQIIWNMLWEQEWNIGFFRAESFPENLPEISWLKTDYKGGWFADPFILSETKDRIELLVEEFHYATRRGRIDLLTVDPRDYSLLDIKVLLETPFHMSFPAIYRHDGKIYVYPENSEEGVLRIYEYNPATRSLENPAEILRDNVVDAIIRKNDQDGRYYLFASKYGSVAANNELLIYSSDSLTGNYEPAGKLDTGNFGARGAGNWLEIDGTLVRPSQDGADLNRYGLGLILSEASFSEGEGFSFKEQRRFYSNSLLYPLGIHTINRLGSLYVVDGLKYRRPKLGAATWIIRDMVANPR